MAAPMHSSPRREHGQVAPRVMTRRTARVTPEQARAELRVVPRQRRTARTVSLIAATVFVLMAGAAAFQTRLAQRQLQIDQLDRDVRAATDQYDLLRRERAELRSPGRLTVEAAALGMTPGNDSEFVALSPDTVAAVLASAGYQVDEPAIAALSEVERLALVKQIIAGQP